MRPVKRILFVCVGNACRSPIAEGYARYFAKSLGKELFIASRGTAPATHVSRSSVESMKEEGIDISDHVPRSFEDDDLGKYDIVITMGPEVAGYNPILRNEKVIDWGVPDPIGQPIDEYRKVRDLIKRKVLALIKGL